MNLEKLLAEISVSIELSTKSEIFEACELIIIAQAMQPSERATLKCAYKEGPLWDGDVPSKSGRDNLLGMDLIAKVISKGESGFNACTYKGAEVYTLISAMEKG